MKYYSELTKEFYDSEKDCLKAETEKKKAEEEKIAQQKKLAEEKERRTKLVEQKRDAYLKAKTDYLDELKKYTKDYNGYKVANKGEIGAFLDSIFGWDF